MNVLSDTLDQIQKKHKILIHKIMKIQFLFSLFIIIIYRFCLFFIIINIILFHF